MSVLIVFPWLIPLSLEIEGFLAGRFKIEIGNLFVFTFVVRHCNNVTWETQSSSLRQIWRKLEPDGG